MELHPIYVTPDVIYLKHLLSVNRHKDYSKFSANRRVISKINYLRDCTSWRNLCDK